MKPAGTLFIAINNDLGLKSHRKLPRPVNAGYAYALWFAVKLLNILKYTLAFRPMEAILPILRYRSRLGRSLTHYIVDWVGGMSYQFPCYDVLVSYLKARGCTAQRQAQYQSWL